MLCKYNTLWYRLVIMEQKKGKETRKQTVGNNKWYIKNTETANGTV